MKNKPDERTMRPRERKRWLQEYIYANKHVDVLDSAFVDAYLLHTNASFKPANWGAYHSQMLGQDMLEMHEEGILDREARSLGENWMPGFPKWVFGYSIRLLDTEL